MNGLPVRGEAMGADVLVRLGNGKKVVWRCSSEKKVSKSLRL
jgi:hypothetical protein